MSTAFQQTHQTLERYLQDLQTHGDFAAHFSDDVVVSFEGGDQRVEGREAARQLIEAAHALGEIKLRSFFTGEDHATIEATFIRRDRTAVPYAAIYDLDGDKITALPLYMTGAIELRACRTARPARHVRRAPAALGAVPPNPGIAVHDDPRDRSPGRMPE